MCTKYGQFLQIFMDKSSVTTLPTVIYMVCSPGASDRRLHHEHLTTHDSEDQLGWGVCLAGRIPSLREKPIMSFLDRKLVTSLNMYWYSLLLFIIKETYTYVTIRKKRTLVWCMRKTSYFMASRSSLPVLAGISAELPWCSKWGEMPADGVREMLLLVLPDWTRSVCG